MTGPRVLDVNASLRELSSLLASLTASTITIRYEMEDSLPGIQLDPGELDQIIVNLFLNAKQAVTGRGEIIVRTRALPRKGAARVAIEVQDDGHGMSREVAARMFEPRFTTRTQGSGLGLATVREILDRAGGTVEVESEEGRGTTVRVLFPIGERGAAARPAAPARSGWAGARTVLVVDDEPAVRRVMVAALRRQGYQVVEAADGPAALALFLGDTAAVDMVISDVMLPGESGVDLVRRMMDERPDLKALFVSGYSAKELLQQDPALGRWAIIEKPFTIEELTGSVERVWGSTEASASG